MYNKSLPFELAHVAGNDWVLFNTGEGCIKGHKSLWNGSKVLKVNLAPQHALGSYKIVQH
jgi:hypothetical protein